MKTLVLTPEYAASLDVSACVMHEKPRRKPPWKGCISIKWLSWNVCSIPCSKTPSKHLRNMHVNDTGRKVLIVHDSGVLGIGEIRDSFQAAGVQPVLIMRLKRRARQGTNWADTGRSARSSLQWIPSIPQDFVVGYRAINLDIALWLKSLSTAKSYSLNSTGGISKVDGDCVAKTSSKKATASSIGVTFGSLEWIKDLALFILWDLLKSRVAAFVEGAFMSCEESRSGLDLALDTS
jgi:hypothetical protein